MSLESAAWRITGPIDAAINLTINLLIPWYFLRASGPLPLLGVPSLYIFLGPMVFCVLLIASAMGYWNGVRFSADPKTVPGWLGRAWGRGFLLAIGGSAALGLVMLLVNRWQPEWRVPALAVILTSGFGSAVLGYFSQVSGVLAGRRYVQSLPLRD